ncbi:MAG: 23S rRNA (pseudouridine(1915)-N(3))-methyltransferase RlmH [Gemmatimonadales bacterium]|nr:23S rRNA (pseudouridine(1915)-N(3))-methyltransferase RlmH [Gemmatimonadales bacterium]
MELLLLAVGRLRPYYRAACDDYLKRLTRYATVREHEVRESGRAATPAVGRREEAERLRDALPDRAVVVALHRGGQAWTSEELARRLDRWREGGRPVAVVIGGAGGLSDDFLAAAAIRWSLGPMTLPHELARVVVLEQWYRAWTILRGEPYHKGRGG